MDGEDGFDWRETEADRVIARLGRLALGAVANPGVMLENGSWRGYRINVEVDLKHVGSSTCWWLFLDQKTARKAYSRMVRRLYRSRRIEQFRICLQRADAEAWKEMIHFESQPPLTC